MTFERALFSPSFEIAFIRPSIHFWQTCNDVCLKAKLKCYHQRVENVKKKIYFLLFINYIASESEREIFQTFRTLTLHLQHTISEYALPLRLYLIPRKICVYRFLNVQHVPYTRIHLFLCL
jgi:hypothetical protein